MRYFLSQSGAVFCIWPCYSIFSIPIDWVEQDLPTFCLLVVSDYLTNLDLCYSMVTLPDWEFSDRPIKNKMQVRLNTLKKTFCTGIPFFFKPLKEKAMAVPIMKTNLQKETLSAYWWLKEKKTMKDTKMRSKWRFIVNSCHWKFVAAKPHPAPNFAQGKVAAKLFPE